MANVESLFWETVRAIEPTQPQKEAAAASHQHLRTLLTSGKTILTTSPIQKMIQNSYLSGSYARDTAIRPIDDVDIIFLIDYAEAARLTGVQKPAPNLILDMFAREIRNHYPVSSVIGQRRSVKLEMNHLSIDVVPAVADQGQFIWVPDQSEGKWIKSSPKLHEQFASRINAKQNMKAKPLIKLLKYWNSHLPESSQLKSFTVETIALRLFDSLVFNELGQGLGLFWDFVGWRGGYQPRHKWSLDCGVDLDWLLASVQDVAGTGTNVLQGTPQSAIQSFVKYCAWSRDNLIAAMDSPYSTTAKEKLDEVFRPK